MALPTGMSAEKAEPEPPPEEDLLSAMQVAILPTLEPSDIAVGQGEGPLETAPPPVVQPPSLEEEPPILDMAQVEVVEEEEPIVEEEPIEEEYPLEEEPPLEDPNPNGLTDPNEQEESTSETPPVYQGSGTSDSEASIAFFSWAQQIAARYELTDLPEQVSDPLIVVADSSQCRTPEPQTVSVGIIANAEGAILEDPQLLKSSGWNDLNDQAIDHAKSYDSYPTGGEIKSFLYEVEITYGPEGCTANAAG